MSNEKPIDWRDYFKGPFLWENQHVYDSNNHSLVGDLAWYSVDDQVEGDNRAIADEVMRQIGEVLITTLNATWKRAVDNSERSDFDKWWKPNGKFRLANIRAMCNEAGAIRGRRSWWANIENAASWAFEAGRDCKWKDREELAALCRKVTHLEKYIEEMEAVWEEYIQKQLPGFEKLCEVLAERGEKLKEKE